MGQRRAREVDKRHVNERGNGAKMVGEFDQLVVPASQKLRIATWFVCYERQW